MKKFEIEEIQELAQRLLILCAKASIENEEQDKQIEKDRQRFNVAWRNIRRKKE